MLEIAIDYLKKGFSVIPLIYKDKKPAGNNQATSKTEAKNIAN